MTEVAVCTGITTAYDHPRKDIFSDGVDYLFFCDAESEHLAEERWERIRLPETSEHPRIQAKPAKYDPHLIERLREYRYLIWIDGGIHITSESFVDELLGHVQNGMAISPHFDGRDDAYGEATIDGGKYAEEPLAEQAAFYRGRGLPDHYGLYETGVLARDMTHPVVPELGALWRSQIDRWTYQDQVSLPYCLWLLHYAPGVMDRSFRDMGWVHVNAHRRED